MGAGKWLGLGKARIRRPQAKIIPIKNYSIELMPPKDYLALIAAKKIP
jgi:hypothetical protein